MSMCTFHLPRVFLPSPKVYSKICPSTSPQMHVHTHTAHKHISTQKLCCVLSLTPDPPAGLHAGAQAQQLIHPQS